MFPSGARPDAREVATFPHRINEYPSVWIPLPDGQYLAARLWLPEDAEARPVPAIIECIPYRRRDATSADDELMHPYFAGHGYAALRIDLRGSGDSDGVLEDEYLESEQDDLIAAIHWIAEQLWCTGRVGMMGISWGGFNSLQVAVRRPPALHAIIAVGATVDRYHDDVHYKGGSVLNEHFGWAASSLSFMSRPPDPAIRTDWRELWRARLEAQPFVAETWFAHQTRDAYWRHGSICEDYARLTTPTLAVTGWADAYVNFVAELVAHAAGPCRGIVGPWPHAYPHVAIPGPTIGFLQEALRWWDYWLKDRETGIMDEPIYRVYCQEFNGADPHAEHTPGHWLGESQWPSTNVHHQVHALGEAQLWPETAPQADSVRLQAPADNGRQCGEYIPHCAGPEVAGDQRHDDAHALTYDTPVLETPIVVLGRPELCLRVSVDQKQANLIVRVCDVSPEGVSQRVSYGVLNLTHRDGHETPRDVPLETPVDAIVTLNQVCHRFAAGHRLRVSVTTAYWPLIWPSQRSVMLTLDETASHLDLPIREQDDADDTTVSFDEAVFSGPLQHSVTREGAHRRDITTDLVDGWTTQTIIDDFGEITYDHGLVNSASADERYAIHPNDPSTARMSKSWTQHFQRGDWHAYTETWAELHCDAEWFYLDARLQAFEAGQRFVDRRWSTKCRRNGV